MLVGLPIHGRQSGCSKHLLQPLDRASGESADRAEPALVTSINLSPSNFHLALSFQIGVWQSVAADGGEVGNEALQGRDGQATHQHGPTATFHRSHLWLSLHLGLGLAWIALLATRAPSGSGHGTAAGGR